MKRLHVHVTVPDLTESIQFYSGLFGAVPTKQKSDYAKWQLEDPCVNFAISTRSNNIGLDHLGIQVENECELVEINERLKQASQQYGDIQSGTCCYAESSKSWSVDKAGIAWESFVTMSDAEVFGADEPTIKTTTCCPETKNASSSCC